MRHTFSQENNSLSWVECQCKEFSSRNEWPWVQSSALEQPEAMSMMCRTTKLLVPQSLPLHSPWFSPPEAAQVSEKHARGTKRNASAFFCLTFQFTPVNWEHSTQTRACWITSHQLYKGKPPRDKVHHPSSSDGAPEIKYTPYQQPHKQLCISVGTKHCTFPQKASTYRLFLYEATTVCQRCTDEDSSDYGCFWNCKTTASLDKFASKASMVKSLIA